MSDGATTYEEELERHGKLVYRNRGMSMLPMLRQDRDLIVIEPRPEGRCRKYDVVLFKQDDRYILHRIVRILPEGYVTCGDHNPWKDRPIAEDQILGVLTSFVRDGREIPVTDRSYRVYERAWCALYPARVLARETRKALGKIKRKLLKYR